MFDVSDTGTGVFPPYVPHLTELIYLQKNSFTFLATYKTSFFDIIGWHGR